MKIEGNK